MHPFLLIIPILTGLATWLVLELASRLLIYPTRPIRFLGFRIQGIWPSQQPQIASQLGDFAQKQLLDEDLIGKKIQDSIRFEKFKENIEIHLEDFLRNKLKDKIPMLSLLISDKTIGSVKEMFVKELEILFPKLITQLTGQLKDNIKIKEMVEAKINAIPPEKIAEQYKAQKPKLAKAKWLAFLFGLLIGFVQLALIYWFQQG